MQGQPAKPKISATAKYDIEALKKQSDEFGRKLKALKSELKASDGFWFPYDTMTNLWNMDYLLEGQYRDIGQLIGDQPVADVGAADGDLAFFLESVGIRCQIIDHIGPNYNSLFGAKLLKESLNSSVEIHDIDLDSYFALPNERYGLVIFLNILYHLKNPFYVLEKFAKCTDYLVLSTRITKYLKPKPAELNMHASYIEDAPIAYLLESRESNNDPTNYWIFTETCLLRLLNRTGWEVLNLKRIGNLEYSDPFSCEGDERAICLLKSCQRSVH